MIEASKKKHRPDSQNRPNPLLARIIILVIKILKGGDGRSFINHDYPEDHQNQNEVKKDGVEFLYLRSKGHHFTVISPPTTIQKLQGLILPTRPSLQFLALPIPSPEAKDGMEQS